MGAGKAITKTKSALLIIAAITAIIFVISAVWVIVNLDNRNVQYEAITIVYCNEKGERVRIVHLSDLHIGSLAVDTEQMISAIEDRVPDIIVITGDLIGSRQTVDSGQIMTFAGSLTAIAPVFFVAGNHEVNNIDRQLLEYNLTVGGIEVLNNRSVQTKIRGVSIIIAGICYSNNGRITVQQDISQVKQSYVIALNHRPTFGIDALSADGLSFCPDLILAGHIHGGQIRIFGRGLLCPDRLLLPTYSAGLYRGRNNTAKMIVSRGLGNSLVPFRINNRPHVPIVDIMF